MKQLTCPIDGKPCEADCPDRYIDYPKEGCALITAMELDFQPFNLGGGDVALLYIPGRGEAAHD